MTAAEPFAAIAARVATGARLRTVRRLTGGVSASVHALELDTADGGQRTVVVRQHGAAAWKPSHERVTVMEHDLLRVLYDAGLPVPEPLLLDTSARLLPGPFLVTTFIDGSDAIPESRRAACLDAMAAMLARLHALPAGALPELPARLDPLPELFDYVPRVQLRAQPRALPEPDWPTLREHLAGCTDSAYRGPPALLHGDFWPGNLLWRDGRLVGVLDWEDAALGDPACDVAGCRLELLWKFGPAALAQFTRSYARRRPLDTRRLAWWEVFVGSAGVHFMGAWGLDADREAAMRRQAFGFVRAAAAALRAGRPPA